MLAISATVTRYVDRAFAPLGNAARTVFDRFDYVFERWFAVMDTIERVLWTVAMALATFLVIIIAGQVVSRYVFTYVPPWGGEMGRALGIWASLLLLPALIWSDKHLQVEFMFERLPLRMRRRIRSLQLAMISLFGAAYAYYGWNYAITAGFRSASTSLHHFFKYFPGIDSSFRLDIFWVYVILPISGVLFVVAAVSKLLQINYNPDQLQEDYSERYGAIEMEG